MKHTIKLLTLAFTLAAILTLTGCPGPVTPDMPCTHVDYETSGYCENCKEYKFTNQFTVRVYKSKDEFIKDSNFSSELSSNNENNNPYDECKFSFESKNPSMTVDTLIHKKLRYLNYSVIAFKKKGLPTPTTSIENEEFINEIYSIYIEPQTN